MYLLSLGVGHIGATLPGPVYALLSGLNAATVGIIALAAVQLSSKAITDSLTRMLVLGSACAGICYSALWYYPLLMVVGGITTMSWDTWLVRLVGRYKAGLERRRRRRSIEGQRGDAVAGDVTLGDTVQPSPTAVRRPGMSRPASERARPRSPAASLQSGAVAATAPNGSYMLSARLAMAIVVAFFGTSIYWCRWWPALQRDSLTKIIASFVGLLLVRSLLHNKSLVLSLFSNMYLAGTIIFGGGPVVIPLLREYVVQPGWVSPRDFLIGLAIIQAFPGPNFNFAVYLGALAVRSTGDHSVLGGFLGFVGIYAPGMILAFGVQGLWRYLRTRAWVVAALRGINAAAVGLIFTAVYRLWEQGYLTANRSNGQSLAREPWWVVVAAVAYSSTCWFRLPPAIAIIIGGTLGLLWYVAVKHK